MRTLHRRGVRAYLTFNTSRSSSTSWPKPRAIGCIAEAGVDALIVQDIGVLWLARDRRARAARLHANQHHQR